MRVLVSLLVLSSVVATSAIARDPEAGVLERMVFCSQFAVRNPDPGTSFNDARSCCALGDPWIAANHMGNCCFDDNYLRDCADRNRINR